MQNRLSIRLKVYSIIIGIVLCITVLSVGMGVFISRRYILKTIENDMILAGKIADKSLSERLSLLKRETSALASRLKSYSDEELQKILPEMARSGGWIGLSVVKRIGSAITFGTSSPSEDSPCVRAAFDGQTVISEPEWSMNNTGFFMRICTPMGDNVLTASLPGLFLSDLVKNFQMWKTSDIFIVDKKGVIIADINHLWVIERYNLTESPVYKTPSNYAFSQQVIKNDSGTYVYTYEGIKYICAFHAIEGFDGWKLGVVSPLEENSAWQIQKILALSGLGFLIFGIMAAIPAGKNIAYGIEFEKEKLIKQLEKIKGLDVQGALRMIGQKKSYYQILRQFCSGIDESIHILKTSAEKGDWKTWVIHIHSLKSILRTIGMKTLGEEAALLEEAGKRKTVSRESTDTFCTSLKDLQKKLRGTGLFSSIPEMDVNINKIEIDTLRSKLDILKYACERHNIKEIESHLADVKNISFSEATDKDLDIISKLIDSFDYDTAVDKIDELLNFLQMPQTMEKQSANKEFSILAIDDEEVNLRTLQLILGVEYTLFTASTGAAALQQLDENLPDLILLDILLPDISGFELLEKLKSNPATAQIPVIIVTSLSGEKEEERGFFLGAVDYITKPFNNAIVRARVKTHLRMIGHIRAIEKLGMIDPLTNIANRRSFDEHMQIEWKRALRHGTNIAFLMMDLDKFKDYNDTYGHPQGDVLLKAVSGTIESSTRGADVVARIGGEEFGVILPNASLKDVLVIAERIRSNVEALHVSTADGCVTRTTISIGVVSLIPTQAMTIEDFISQADKNLYKAKEMGRNRIFSG
ncbi:MAG: diguanylate cyclase [Treponema sp.]|jgi:diguanylate cyclase (GGDEF)-like protein|nr:diguanylate cyclase [Treponema sp.]